MGPTEPLRPPNLLLLITDQQRAPMHWPTEPGWLDALMPADAELRRTGLSFERAFVATCMCSPSRASFFTGTPFGRGTVGLVATLKDGRATGPFRLVFPRGSVTGTFAMPFTISGNEIDFVGTARLTGGTGAYRGISSGDLRARDHNTLDGQNGRLSLDGFATY